MVSKVTNTITIKLKTFTVSSPFTDHWMVWGLSHLFYTAACNRRAQAVG